MLNLWKWALTWEQYGSSLFQSAHQEKSVLYPCILAFKFIEFVFVFKYVCSILAVFITGPTICLIACYQNVHVVLTVVWRLCWCVGTFKNDLGQCSPHLSSVDWARSNVVWRVWQTVIMIGIELLCETKPVKHVWMYLVSVEDAFIAATGAANDSLAPTDLHSRSALLLRLIKFCFCWLLYIGLSCILICSCEKILITLDLILCFKFCSVMVVS